MVTGDSCMGPLFCRSRSGNCCLLEFFRGRVLCPLSCPTIVNRQSQSSSGGFTMAQIFGTTFVTTLMHNVLTNIGATIVTTIPTTTITTTTMATTKMTKTATTPIRTRML